MAYSLIVTTSTLLFVEGMVAQRKGVDTVWLQDSELRCSHLDSLLFFQVMVQIAFWAYLPKMKSIYELTIGTSRSTPAHGISLAQLTQSSAPSHENDGVRYHSHICQPF